MKNLHRKSLSSNNLKSMEESLSTVLMPQNKWVPDNQAHSCFNCNKSFIPFVRPKHHCRRCGKVFCNSCSQNFVMGYEIEAKEKEKKFRFCDYCFQGYKNFIKLKTNPLNKPTETFSQYTNYLIKEKEDFSIKHRVFFTETGNITPLQEKHNDIITKINEDLITFIFKKRNIYDKWYKLLKELVDKAVKDLLTNTNSTQKADFMDINNYIKIKKIPYSDETFTKYVNGVVCRKNINDKNMKNKFISPKILIATQIELAGNTDLTMFDNLIQNEKKQIKKIINKIMKFKPNIILIEKSINGIAYEYFKEANIIVIKKIKHELLKRIARVTKATIIKDINNFEKIPEDKILGTCEKFHIKKFFIDGYKSKSKYDSKSDPLEISFKKEENNDPNYLFLEGCDPFLGGTIIISGPSEAELKIIKDSLKLSLKLVRNFILERDIVTNEILLINQINIEKYKAQIKKSGSFGSFTDEKLLLEEPQRNLYKREGDFSKYLFNKMSLEDVVSRQYIQYTKVGFVRGFLENCNEICANEEAVKFYYQKFNEKDKKLGGIYSPFDFFVEICELPTPVKIEYYSEEDFGLGQYLMLRVNNLNSKCEECKRPRYQHIVLYYFNKVFVKICCELTGMSQVQNLNIEDQLLRQTSETLPKEYPLFDFTKDLTPTHQKSTYNKEPHNKSILSPVTPSAKLVKSNTKPLPSSSTIAKIDIKTYIECSVCWAILTKETQLSQNYLEYSFTRYLLHFFLNNECDDEENSQTAESITNKCRHKSRNRVFDYNGILIKMSSGLSKFYHLERIKDVINDTEHKANLEIIKNNLITLKKEELKAKLKILSNELIKILENSSTMKINENSDKKLIFQSMSLSPTQHDEWKNAIEFQNITNQTNGDFENLEEEEVDELFQLFDNPQLNFNIEASVDLCKSEILFPDEKDTSIDLINLSQRNDTVLSSNEILNFEELKTLEIKLNDKHVRDRQTIYKKLKVEFANSIHYSDNINKAKGNIVSFLYLMKAKIIELNNSVLNHFNNSIFKSFLEIEFVRIKFMRKINELLNIIHFISSEKNKKSKSKNSKPPTMKSIQSKKMMESMKASAQINEAQVTEEDESRTHIKIKLDDEIMNNQTFDDKDDETDSPENFSKMIKENNEFKALTYTPTFLNLYNELNKGQAFIDAKEVKNYRNLQKFKTIPVNEDEPLTLVAHALNSCKYMKEIFVKSEFDEIEKKVKLDKDWKKNQEILNFLEKNLDETETEINEKNILFTLKSYIKTTTFKKSSDHQNLETSNEDFEESVNLKKLKSKFFCEKTKVTIYYPTLFEALRMAYGISLSEFIQSIALNNQWKENSGGKSKAKFIKSYDELYIIKQLQKNEFFMIQSYAKNFFGYMWKVLNGSMESIMTKIFGLYEVSINNTTYYYIVMENLFYGLKSDNLKIFDLKGSETNRFMKKTKNSQTLLDTNYKLERNNEPLAIYEKDFRYFKKAYENDSSFLSEHNLIDYSLLLIIDEKNLNIRTGIIDFLRIYTWDKQLEHMGKIVINVGAIPTITNPFEYKERFINALKKFFMEAKI